MSIGITQKFYCLGGLVSCIGAWRGSSSPRSALCSPRSYCSGAANPQESFHGPSLAGPSSPFSFDRNFSPLWAVMGRYAFPFSAKNPAASSRVMAASTAYRLLSTSSSMEGNSFTCSMVRVPALSEKTYRSVTCWEVE